MFISVNNPASVKKLSCKKKTSTEERFEREEMKNKKVSWPNYPQYCFLF